MKRQDYFPTRIGDQLVWLNVFKVNIAKHAAALGISAPALAAVLLDIENALYALQKYRGSIETFAAAGYHLIDAVLYNDDNASPISWITFTAPADAPAAVDYGCLKRLFAFIGREVKLSDGYTRPIAIELGVEGTVKHAPDAFTTMPEFSLRPTSGGKAEIVWTKGEFDGVKIELDLGADGLKTDIDLRPNYTIDWLPTAGTAVNIRVRLRYIYKGEDFGQWSGWHRWTLANV